LPYKYVNKLPNSNYFPQIYNWSSISMWPFYLETLFSQLKLLNTNVTIKQKPKSPTKFATLACKNNTYSHIHDFSKIKSFVLSWNMSWNIFIDLQIRIRPQNQVLLVLNIHKVIKNDTFHIWDCKIVAPPYCDQNIIIYKVVHGLSSS
jgi:hypothetical protein